jgi:hypothetical protein
MPQSAASEEGATGAVALPREGLGGKPRCVTFDVRLTFLCCRH